MTMCVLASQTTTVMGSSVWWTGLSPPEADPVHSVSRLGEDCASDGQNWCFGSSPCLHYLHLTSFHVSGCAEQTLWPGTLLVHCCFLDETGIASSLPMVHSS